MALMGHGTFNSNKMYFVLNPWLIEYQKKLSKLTAKSFLKKHDNCQRHIFPNECVKTFLMKFC